MARSGTSDTPRRNVLITGAAGEIGSVLRRALPPHCTLLRSSDLHDVTPEAGNEESHPFDLRDFAATRAAMAGIDTVFHFGGIPIEDEWHAIRDVNIEGTYNIYEAARLEGVRRVVFASSNHVLGFRRRDAATGPHEIPRPDSRYGVSKVFGEAVGRLYADKYGIETISLRIGQFRPRPTNRRMLSLWLSHSDMAELAIRCLLAEDIHFEIVYGISANTRAWYVNPGAGRIGFVARDNAETFAAEITAEAMIEDPVEAEFQGGPFCSAEFAGNLRSVD